MPKYLGAPRRLVPSLLSGVLVASVAAVVLTSASTPAGAAAPPQQPGTYVPIPAVNLLDTGAAIGVPTKTPVPGHGTVTVQISGRGNVPAGASAVAMTLAVSSPGSGYVTVYPAGSSVPGAASIDFAPNQIATNLAYAKLSAGGAISLYTGTASTSRLWVNVSGYFISGTPTDAGTYVPLQPANVLDTGTGVGTGGHVALVPAGGTVTVKVAGAGGVPLSTAASATMNVAVISTTSGGFLTAYASDQTRPQAASVDYPAHAIIASLTTIGLGANGSVTFYNGSSAGIRVVANVFGYYLAGTPTVRGSFVQVTPTNLYDSAADGGTIAAHGTIDPKVVSSVARANAWTDGRSALVTAVAVVNPKSSGFLTAYSAQSPNPNAANLDFAPGRMTLNGAVIQVTDQGDVDIYNGSSGAIRAVVNLFGYFLDGPVSSLHWTGPTDVDPRRGFPTAVSCVGTTFCVEVDENGHYTTFSGGVWSQPLDSPATELQSVSCVSTSFCMAEDGSGNTYRYNGSTWSAAGTIGWTNPQWVGAQALSCTATTFCMAVNVSQAAIFSGSSWGSPVALAGLTNGGVGAVSCVPATTNCVAAGGITVSAGVYHGVVIASQGSAWGQPVNVATTDYLESVSCPTTSFCAAVGFNNQVVTYTGTWTVRFTLPSSRPFIETDISCASAAFCAVASVGTDFTARYQIYNGSSWTADAPIGSGQHAAINCPAVGSCVEFDAQGDETTFASGAWSTPVQVDPLGASMASVSCRSTQFCIAVDTAGSAFTYNGVSWARTVVDIANPMLWVDCLPTLCVGVDRHGGARTLTNTGWSARQTADPAGGDLVGLSCTSTTFCMAVATNGDATSWNGTAWTSVVVATASEPTRVLTTVSCVSGSFCVAGDNEGGAYTWNGSTWSARVATQASSNVVIPELWCVSTTFCVMATYANVMTYDGQTWTQADSHLTGQPTTVMCTSATFCVVVATGDEAVTFDGTQWSVPTHLISGIQTPEFNDRPESVSCVSPSFCVLVNDETSWVGAP